MASMSGGKFIADTVHGHGLTHVFFMPYIGPASADGNGTARHQEGANAR